MKLYKYIIMTCNSYKYVEKAMYLVFNTIKYFMNCTPLHFIKLSINEFILGYYICEIEMYNMSQRFTIVILLIFCPNVLYYQGKPVDKIVQICVCFIRMTET